LVARYHCGQYRGRLTKDNASVASYDGVNIDTIIQSLRSIVDQLLEVKLKKRVVGPPNSSEYSIALQQITHILSVTEKVMLVAHSKAEGARLPMNQLRLIGGFSSTVETFLCYVALASRLGDELGYMPTTNCSNMDPVLSMLLKDNGYTAPSFPAEEEGLTLRDEVLEAIRQQDWLE
jgi:hypothetical protein